MLKLLTHRHLDDLQPPSLPHATIPHGAKDAEAVVAHLKSVPVKQQPLSRFLSEATRCAKSDVPALMSWVWRCVVAPSDGQPYGDETNASITVRNSAQLGDGFISKVNQPS